jgi:hypothetical protein
MLYVLPILSKNLTIGQYKLQIDVICIATTTTYKLS